MLCPYCKHDHTNVIETRSSPDYDKRIRICRGCGSNFKTIERVAVYASRATGYIEIGPEPKPEPYVAHMPEPYVAQLNDSDLATITPTAQPLLVEWWNVSRRSKWGKRAAWTELAWRQNIRRIGALPHWKQEVLAKAGVEHGWQSLKVDYLTKSDSEPPADAGLQPKSAAMQDAITAWNNRVA